MNTDDTLWVDYTRFVGTIFIVILHSAAPILYRFNLLPLSYWWAGNLFDSSFRTAVPLFLMISGYLLLNKHDTLAVFFNKRFKKVVLLLILWSIFYIFWRIYVENNLTQNYQELDNFLITPVYTHLWYLYAIIGVYLFMPLLRVLVAQLNGTMLVYFIALWFIAVSIIPMIEILVGTQSRIDLGMISGFAGYCILGFVIGKVNPTRKIFLLSMFSSLFWISLTALGTYWLTLRDGGILNTQF